MLKGVLERNSTKAKPRWASSALPPALLRPTTATATANRSPEARTSPNTRLRPSSGAVRPLSGRIFIRRTVRHGWMAKAFTEGSQVSLDEMGSSDSVDAFFEDDLTTETKEEGLNQLLKCSVVQGKSDKSKQQRDWVSGEVKIPEFHCPRCREHWYGASPVPCDEELAKLIMSGSWYSEKDEQEKRQSRTNLVDKTSDSQHEKKTANLSNKSNLPELTSRTAHSDFKRNMSSTTQFLTPPNMADKHRKSNKKKISFQFDNDDLTSGSSGELTDDNAMRSNKWGKRQAGDCSNSSNGDSQAKIGADVKNGARKHNKRSLELSVGNDTDSGSSSTLLELSNTRDSVGYSNDAQGLTTKNRFDRKNKRIKNSNPIDGGGGTDTSTGPATLSTKPKGAKNTLDAEDDPNSWLLLSGKGGKENNSLNNQSLPAVSNNERIRKTSRGGKSKGDGTNAIVGEGGTCDYITGDVGHSTKLNRDPDLWNGRPRRSRSSSINGSTGVSRVGSQSSLLNGGSPRNKKATTGGGVQVGNERGSYSDNKGRPASPGITGSSKSLGEAFPSSLTTAWTTDKHNITKTSSEGANQQKFLPPIIHKNANQGDYSHFGLNITRAYTFSYFSYVPS